MLVYSSFLYYIVWYCTIRYYIMRYCILYLRCIVYYILNYIRVFYVICFFKVFMWIDRLSVAPEASEKGQRRGGSGRALVEVI